MNESLVNQINFQSEDISRQLIELSHKSQGRIQEITQATLVMVKLHRCQVLGPSDDLTSAMDRIDQVIQDSSNLIHSLQESAIDSQFSVLRLKHQVRQINSLLDILGIAS